MVDAMKKVLVLLTILAFTTSAYAKEKPETVILRDIRGLEWLQSSFGDRRAHIASSMIVLSQRGVPLHRSPDEYASAVSNKLTVDPSKYSSTVTEILATIAQEDGP